MKKLCENKDNKKKRKSIKWVRHKKKNERKISRIVNKSEEF